MTGEKPWVMFPFSRFVAMVVAIGNSSAHVQSLSTLATKSVEGGVAGKEEGVFLTWEDLWVIVSTGKNGRKPILEGLKGYAKQGQRLAITVPYGCGKSTLLDALAERETETREAVDKEGVWW